MNVKGTSEIYTNSFNYPKNGVTGLHERTYYFDVPYGRIACIDTESYKVFDKQMEWLENAMSDVKGFKIVLMHRSAFPMRYNEEYIRELSKNFEAIGVDLVLSGHDHIYSRTTMKANKRVAVNEGVTYIIGGSSSGSKYYSEDDDINRHWKGFIYDNNDPVFTLVEMKAHEMKIEAYAVRDEVHKIDYVVIKHE